MISNIVRACMFAGTWYKHDPVVLENQLTTLFNNAQTTTPADGSKLKVLIGPHAGVDASG